MADIAPIRGMLFDPTKVEIAKVIAPPYDVIGSEERARLEELEPHNVVRLILPRGDGDARYRGAADLMQRWEAEGVLRRDDRSAIYRYHQTFRIPQLGSRSSTRRGFIAAVRLHDYDEGIILPHERTFCGPKEDRLRLMRASHTHFSQVFGLYKDPTCETDRVFEAVERTGPALEGKTGDGTLHRLWRVQDLETIAKISRFMARVSVYIADGHHRYETMLALRNELRAANGGLLRPDSAAEFGTFFLTNMNELGPVLATHRLVHSLEEFSIDTFLDRAAKYFTITSVPHGARDTAVLSAVMEQPRSRPTFVVIAAGHDTAWQLELEVDPLELGLTGSNEVLALDVTILHALVLERLLGIDRATQDAQTNLTYTKDPREVVEAISSRKAQVGFVMHATRVEQVCAVADSKQRMPPKSTFFYPKIASGLVINPIHADENLDLELDTSRACEPPKG